MNEQSLKEKLRFIANERNMTFQEVWKKVALERFLARLSASDLKSQFIFKGGLLLSYYLELGRETKDIDFLATNVEANEESIKQKLLEIADTQVDDGFGFLFGKIDQLEQTHMNYPGYRIKLNVTFGSIKDIVQLDIGVGDVVSPMEISLDPIMYKKSMLFDGEILLNVYPVNTIFAEKLETLVYRGAANSRMKDYHDLWVLCQSSLIDKKQLKTDIESTFNHRETKLSFPISYEDEETQKLQALWANHLKINDGHGLPKKVDDVVSLINNMINDLFK